MTINLTSEQIEAAVQGAILQTITTEQRDMLLKGALASLMRVPSSTGYGTPRSPLQESFDNAVSKYAREVVMAHLAENADFRAALDKLIADSLARFMAQDQAVVAEQIAQAITTLFTRERY